MARLAGVNKKEVADDSVPHLSFNPEVTPETALPPPPAEKIAELKRLEPKLPYTWTIWEQHFPNAGVKDYASLTKEVTSFSTLTQFWSCFNHMPQPSILFSGKRFGRRDENGAQTYIEALMFFRKGIRPAWEDPQNAKGGHFQLSIQPRTANSSATLDELWNNIVLGTVSGFIQPIEMVNGIRLVDKLRGKTPSARIELWFNEMDKGEGGKTFDLKGSFERCMRTATDGLSRKVTWDYTQMISHEPQ